MFPLNDAVLVSSVDFFRRSGLTPIPVPGTWYLSAVHGDHTVLTYVLVVTVPTTGFLPVDR